MAFVDNERKRLTEMKEKLAGSVVVGNSEEKAMTVASEPADSDDKD